MGTGLTRVGAPHGLTRLTRTIDYASAAGSSHTGYRITKVTNAASNGAISYGALTYDYTQLTTTGID